LTSNNKWIKKITDRYLENWKKNSLRKDQVSHFKNTLILDLKNIEVETLQSLYQDIEKHDFKFSSLATQIIDSCKTIKLGETYNAKIFLVPVNKDKKITAKITSYLPFKEGYFNYKNCPKTRGIKRYGGVIIYQKLSGESLVFPFSNQYEVK